MANAIIDAIRTSRRTSARREEDDLAVGTPIPHPNDRRGSAPTSVRPPSEAAARDEDAGHVIRHFSEM